MTEFEINDIFNDEAIKKMDKVARLHHLCGQLMAIEEELRADYNLGLEFIRINDV